MGSSQNLGQRSPKKAADRHFWDKRVERTEGAARADSIDHRKNHCGTGLKRSACSETYCSNGIGARPVSVLKLSSPVLSGLGPCSAITCSESRMLSTIPSGKPS